MRVEKRERQRESERERESGNTVVCHQSRKLTCIHRNRGAPRAVLEYKEERRREERRGGERR